MIIPSPEGLKFQEWGGLVSEQFSGVSVPFDELTWKTWVCALFYVPELVAMNIPQPDGFDTWQAWAERFIGAVR